MSRHLWKATVAAKQMPVFSLHRVMDEDANVTIWLKGAVQMSGGDSVAVHCPSCCAPLLPGGATPGRLCQSCPGGHARTRLWSSMLWGTALQLFPQGINPGPTWCDICLAHKARMSKTKTQVLGRRDGGREAERTLFCKRFTQRGLGSKTLWRYKQ